MAAQPKKPCTNALVPLTQSMDCITNAFCHTPPPVPGIFLSTLCHKCAWAVVVEEEIDLPTDQIAKVQNF